ncbi:HAD-IB family hydrolase [Flammeovirgaceae bacterium SG7u.111]|nr:HAD-IB family hydrolase [Flammeovirgaceae bacterium SG7u.132]WPO36450.1 HAD-IB family hydrolase [Flammeovirgaceae bacterium SG7u.111]
MKPAIAFFDFDGTITTKDSFIEFIKYYRGKPRFYLGFLLLSPVLVLFKLKLIANWKAKEMVMRYFFGGSDETDFQQACDEFGEKIIPQLVRSRALEKIKQHQQDETRVVLVSASAENWLSFWCKQQKIECFASRLEVANGKITGKLVGKNCYGPEKVARIRQKIKISEYKTVYAYGDSSGDKEMLALAKYKFYRPFRREELQ